MGALWGLISGGKEKSISALAGDGRVAKGAAVVSCGRQGSGGDPESPSSSIDRISLNSLSAESPNSGNDIDRVIINAALLGGGRRGLPAAVSLVPPVVVAVEGCELRLLLLGRTSDL
jgi:hypothetical protein